MIPRHSLQYLGSSSSSPLEVAVLDLLPGVEVKVTVDNVPLREYKDNEADSQAEGGVVGRHRAARTVSKYIESVTDKEFCVNLSIKAPYHFDSPSLTFKVSVDGVKVRSMFAPKLSRQVLAKSPWELVVDGVPMKDSQGLPIVKRFRFSKINTCKLSTI
jgi:hypothetical protein